MLTNAMAKALPLRWAWSAAERNWRCASAWSSKATAPQRRLGDRKLVWIAVAGGFGEGRLGDLAQAVGYSPANHLAVHSAPSASMMAS